MNNLNKTKDKLIYILVFILGVSVCNNVIYAFKMGRTYINFSYIYGIIFFIYLVATKRMNIKKIFLEINIYFRLFIVTVFISIIPATIVFLEKPSNILSCIKGIMFWIMYIILYMDVIAVKKYKKNIFYGLACGFILNIILSLIQYITYENGNYFSLYYLFPQPAFQINSYFGASNFLQNSVDTFNVYAYRAQGFFLETSYYMAFIAGTALFLAVASKNKMVKILCTITMIFIIIMTSTGNMIVVIGTFALYFIMKYLKTYKNKEKKQKIKTKNVTYVFFTAIILVIFTITNYSKVVNFVNKNNIFDKIINNINTANLTNNDNKERLNSMIWALKLVPSYPFGVGFNMAPTLLDREYEEGVLARNTAFNRLITTQLEQGIFGTIFYLLYMYQISAVLILKARKKETLAIGICILGIFICQIGNGIGYFPFILMMFALADIERTELKENLDMEKIE